MTDKPTIDCKMDCCKSRKELDALGPVHVREGYIYNKDGTFHVDLWYPRTEKSPIKAVEIGLSDVRCADSIRITYDFDRDGWKIEQAQAHEWECDDPVCDPKWTETAFCPAWPFGIEDELEDELYDR
jgi:hypothetical protein